MFNNKLYLEFGGKLLFDYHASRVLPGFDPNVKMRLLLQLKEKADILLCIYAGDIERKKVRADFGITYDVDALKLIDDLRDWGLGILGVVITRFDNQPAAKIFKNRLERRNIKVYTHRFTKGYPTDIERGIKAGYAKFETFPIWDLPLKHPVNIAYEAATADIGDFNLIDSFHLEAYGKQAVNYNRDVEIFPVLKCILEKLTGTEPIYKSPTDMGVNRANSGIIDDKVVSWAAEQEVIRRYFRYSCEYAMGFVDKDTVQRVELLLKELNVKPEDRRVVKPAMDAALEAEKQKKGNKGIFCGAAIELKDGTILTGKNSPLMHASSSLVLNAVKKLAGIEDQIHLVSPDIIESISSLKKDILSAKSISLDLEETLISISISATTNPTAKKALKKLKELKGCEVHLTHIPTPGDEAGLKRLGVNLTSEPSFSTKDLFSA
jgi:uncharacterized protein (UPF0371 family)